MSIALRWAYILAAPICLVQGQSFSPPNIIQTFASNGTAIASPTASVKLSVSGAGTLTLSASTQSGGNWLSVTPATGPSPLTATVTIDPSGLPDGTYLGAVTAGTTSLPVTILVGDPGPQLPPNEHRAEDSVLGSGLGRDGDDKARRCESLD
jgi:Viral BACON domain